MASEYSVYGKGIDERTATVAASRRLPPNAVEKSVGLYRGVDDPSSVLAEIRYTLPDIERGRKTPVFGSGALPTEVEVLYRSR